MTLRDLADDTWVRAVDGSAARVVDHVLETAGIRPPLLLAGHGDEPVETQVFVAAGEAVAAAYDLNVIVNRERITVVSIAGPAPVRHVQAAVLRECPEPATRALFDLLRDLGVEHTRRLARGRAGA